MSRLRKVELSLLDRRVENSKLALCVDIWTSPQNVAYLGILAFYIDKDWKFRTSLIGFEHLQHDHSGSQLAEIITAVLIRHNLLPHVHALTTDNASNNKKLTDAISIFVKKHIPKKIRWISDKVIRIPCLAHVVQLSLGVLLGKMRINPTKDELQKAWDEKQESAELDTLKQGKAKNALPFTMAKVCL